MTNSIKFIGHYDNIVNDTKLLFQKVGILLNAEDGTTKPLITNGQFERAFATKRTKRGGNSLELETSFNISIAPAKFTDDGQWNALFQKMYGDDVKFYESIMMNRQSNIGTTNAIQ